MRDKTKSACARAITGGQQCRLTRKLASSMLGRPIPHEEYSSLYNPFDENFKSTRFYVKIGMGDLHGMGDTTTDAAIDSCSDVNLISLNVLKIMCPEWQNLPYAGRIHLISHSKHKIPVCDTKWIPVRLMNPHVKPILLKFVVTTDEDELLLGAEFLKQNNLSMFAFREGDADNKYNYQMLIPTELSDRGQIEHVPIYHNTQHFVGANMHTVKLKPFCSEFVRFRVRDIKHIGQVCVSQPADQDYTSWSASPCVIYPSLAEISEENGYRVVKALVVNCGKRTTRLRPDALKCVVEAVSKEDTSIIPVDALREDSKREQFLGAMQKQNVAFCRQVVTAINNGDVCMPNLYDENDVANFGELDDVPNNLTFGDGGYAKEPVDCIPWANIPVEYHAAVRHLFAVKYPNVLSRHQYDMGNISRTLGQMFIPLIDKVPRSRKVYFSNEKDLKMLNDILMSMLKYQIIKRSQSAWGAPVFLLRRKSGQQPLRLLCAICDLNEVLVKPVPILPNIDKLLQSLTSSGVGLMSSLDLTNGFHSVEIFPPHQSRLSFLTPFGSFKFARGVMGLSTLPAFYAAKIFEMVHTDPITGKYDPLPGVWPFMDDIPVVTPAHENPNVEFDLHYQVLDKLLFRIAFHDAKISPEKLVLFQRKAVILGHLIEDGKIKVDPKRIQKIRDAPMPMNLKGAQKWSGFLASLKPFAPLELGRCHAVLSSLTSAKQTFKIGPEHVAAFEAAKHILTTHDFFLEIPSSNKVKVLYTDASQLCLGAILLEIDAPIEVVKRRSELKRNSFPPGDKLARSAAWLQLDIWPSKRTPADGNCFYHALTDQFQILGMHNFPMDHYELRLAIANFAMNHPRKHEWRKLVTIDYDNWSQFIDAVIARDSYTDALGIMVQCAAEFMRRHIYILLPSDTVHQISGGLEADHKPPVWLGFYPGRHNSGDGGHFQSLMNFTPNNFSRFTSMQEVQNDFHSMNQLEIFNYVREELFTKNRGKMTIKAIAYYSKVIAEADRHKAIYEKELMALIGALNTFEDYISHVPCVITLIDSRTAYFLAAKGIHKSAVKCRRWNVLLQTRFPNLLLHLIGSKDNWSDVLSRLYDVPDYIEKQLDIRCLDVMPIPEMDGKMWTYGDLEAFVENNPTMLEPSPTGRIKEITFTHVQNLHDYKMAINVLQARLTPVSIMRAQKEDRVLWDAVSGGKMREQGYVIASGLIQVRGKIFVPKSLEGVLLAYLHLVGGHGGRDKLLQLVRDSYHLPKDYLKTEQFVKTCHSCFVTNKMTGRKLVWGSIPVPMHPFHTIYVDVLEGLPTNFLKIRGLLVITDYLSKFVMIYPLKHKTAAEVIAHMKSYIQQAGGATFYCITDNGSIFREKTFLSFMAAHGIEISPSAAYHSRARGVVEVQNRIIQILLAKLLLNAKTYDFTDIFHLCSVLMNNTDNSTTKVSPSEVIYGQKMINIGPFGLQQNDTSRTYLKSKLLRDDLREVAVARQREIEQNIKFAQQQIVKFRNKYFQKKNAHKYEHHSFNSGDIVFVKNHSIPVQGTNAKLRPVLYKSPFIVVSTTPSTIFAMRIADGMTVHLHADDVKLYRPHTGQFADLPAEMTQILGARLTPESMLKLAQHDELPLLYVDGPGNRTKVLRTHPRTRLETRRLELADAEDKAGDEQGWQDTEAEEEVAPAESNDIKEPRVRFELAQQIWAEHKRQANQDGHFLLWHAGHKQHC